jgi:hypothetical protein
MRQLTLIWVIVAPLIAQTPQPAAAPAETASATAAEAPSPVPSAESWLTGSIDVGYRWRTDVGGSFNTYRSIVNLGSGPKLLGADFTLADPKHRAFDQIRVRANGWGDEPYQTVHVDAKKSKLYDFSADYRDIAYFDFLPSYADPLLSRGIVLNEQSFDTRRRLGSFHLDLLPGNWFIPYFAYDRDSGSGTGATTVVTDTNEFPVPNTLRDQTNLFRGGVRFELRRFHATIEQGGTTFKDDQSVFNNSVDLGNVATPVFGQRTALTDMLASYGVRGTSVYSKGLFTASATPWLDVYGQFLYSQPDTSVNYQQTATGNLLLQSQLLFYTSQQYLVSAAAKLPHTSGSLGAEIRPIRRLRIVQSWLTDRLHNAGSAASTQMLTNSGVGISLNIAALLASSLATNYSQEEIDIFCEATSKLTLRGGYRYVWGEANDVVLPPEGLMSSDQAKLRRNVGIGGVTYRPNQKITLRTDAEVAFSGGAYFRTSLYDYQKVHAQARYQALISLSLAADFTLLDNNNPVPGVNYDYRSQQESLSLFWSPLGGKFGDFQGSYTRSTLHSEIGYLVPQTLTPQTSLYRDNAHTATALFNVKLPTVEGIAPKLSAGGSFFISSGSRATSYYQPLATLWLPINKKMSLFADWRYYGYGEAFYLYEGFRTNLVTAGLRFTR